MFDDTNKNTPEQPLESRKTVHDVAIRKAINDVLIDNIGSRLSVALVSGLVAQLTQELVAKYRVTAIPQDIIDRVHYAENALEELTNPEQVDE